ncbi:hypothetical protein JW835_12295 [bacterium]|nr:hypothetical protein [bacterium]
MSINLNKCLIQFYLFTGIIAVTLSIISCNRINTERNAVNQNINRTVRKLNNRILLAIGDSNGLVNGGWPKQLAIRLRNDYVLNHSEGGRTIGFDNCGKSSWNALKNIETYLEWALKCSGQKPIDEIIILLGTNDSKTCFEGKKDEIASNLIRLIAKIRQFDNSGGAPPHITIVTPPPYALDSMVPDKARGGDLRVRSLVPQFHRIALQYHCAYVNIYSLIKPVFHEVTVDHVHLNRKGHAIVADAIAKVLNDLEAPEPPSDVLLNNYQLSWNPSQSRDVIGYEILEGNQIINISDSARIILPHTIMDPAVRARDGYGNLSIAVKQFSEIP